MSPAPAAFWVDRDFAGNGISRYGAYLRDASSERWTDHDQAVEWAVFAWRHATGLVMSPGYVRYNPQVLSARLEHSGWDGSLIAGVSLVSTWSEQLTRGTGPGGGAWRPGRVLAGLADRVSQRGTACYYEPSEADIAAWPCLLTTISLQFTMPFAALAQPPATSTVLLCAGQQAVAVVVAEFNPIVGLVLAVGDTSAEGRAG